jgi:hypothetical protein
MNYDDLVDAMPSWLDAMYGNAPIDKAGCEEFINATYAAKKLEKPLIVWCKSTFQMAALVLCWTNEGSFKPAYRCAQSDQLQTRNLWRQLIIDIENQDLEKQFKEFSTPDAEDIRATHAPLDLTIEMGSHFERTPEKLADDFAEMFEEARPVFERPYRLASKKLSQRGLDHSPAVRQVIDDLLLAAETDGILEAFDFRSRWSATKLPPAPKVHETLADSIQRKITESKGAKDPSAFITSNLLDKILLGPKKLETAFLNFMRSVLIQRKQDDSAKNTANCPFACMLFPHVALVCEQPVEWVCDAYGRASSLDEGAIVFGDGFKYYFVDSKPIGKEIIENPYAISYLSYDDETDPFVKRVIFQKLGLQRYVSESNMPTLDRTPAGCLYVETKPEREDFKIVELIEDGFNRFVEVAPSCTTVADAIKWLEERQTKPIPEPSVKTIQNVRDRWLSELRSTERVDRREVTSVVEDIYQFAGLEKPRIIICKSPWQLVMIPALIAFTPGQTLDQLKELNPDPSFEPLWRSVFDQIKQEFGISLSDMKVGFAQKELGDFVPVTRGLGHVFRSLHDKVRSELPCVLSEELLEAFLRHETILRRFVSVTIFHNLVYNCQLQTDHFRESVLGPVMHPLKGRWRNQQHFDPEAEGANFDDGWIWHRVSRLMDESLIMWDIAMELGMDVSPREVAGLARWTKLAKAAPFYLFLEKTCIVCDRPTELHWDENLVLHNENGPAFAFADGFAQYAYKGIAVHSALIKEKSLITVERIKNEQNIEVRTVMLSIYGESRFLIDAGADLISEDECGSLFSVEIPDSEPLVMVRVTDSTPSKQGEMATYYLRVPPDMETAKQAVAWTFGMTNPNEYNPDIET